MTQQKSHGAWPYRLPYFGFFCVIGVSARVPDSAPPYLFFGSFEALAPSTNQGFDAQQIEASSGWLALSLRIIGFGLVTPFIEELFVRSWLQRYADVFDKSANFRDVSIAHFSGRSFVLVVVWFIFSH